MKKATNPEIQHLMNEIESLKKTMKNNQSANSDKWLKRTASIISIFLLSSVLLFAAQVTFSPGETISSDSVNNNFSDLYTTRPPVGTILAWHKSMTDTPDLTEGWVECNGQNVVDSESPYDGTALPNLNGTGYFLRGGSESGIIQEDATAVNGLLAGLDGAHTHSVEDRHSLQDSKSPSNTDSGGSDESGRNNYYTTRTTTESETHNHALTGDDETRPANMSIVWIIRIK